LTNVTLLTGTLMVEAGGSSLRTSTERLDLRAAMLPRRLHGRVAISYCLVQDSPHPEVTMDVLLKNKI
jgi:hypothetical protein